MKWPTLSCHVCRKSWCRRRSGSHCNPREVLQCSAGRSVIQSSTVEYCWVASIDEPLRSVRWMFWCHVSCPWTKCSPHSSSSASGFLSYLWCSGLWCSVVWLKCGVMLWYVEREEGLLNWIELIMISSSGDLSQLTSTYMNTYIYTYHTAYISSLSMKNIQQVRSNNESLILREDYW